jgi:hypothetical protein
MTFSIERAEGNVTGPYKPNHKISIHSGSFVYTVISESYGFTLVRQDYQGFGRPPPPESKYYHPNESTTIHEINGDRIKITALAPNQPKPKSDYLPPLD